MCCVSFRVLINFAHVSLRRVFLVKRGRPGRYQERGEEATLTYVKLYGPECAAAMKGFQLV